MQQKLFAPSLGFGALILATHHAFAAPSAPPQLLSRVSVTKKPQDMPQRGGLARFGPRDYPVPRN